MLNNWSSSIDRWLSICQVWSLGKYRFLLLFFCSPQSPNWENIVLEWLGVYPLVIWHSYRKWQFTVSFPLWMVIFLSCLKLPEGTAVFPTLLCDSIFWVSLRLCPRWVCMSQLLSSGLEGAIKGAFGVFIFPTYSLINGEPATELLRVSQPTH